MHWTVTGISGSGKSHYLKRFVIPAAKRNGVMVAVLDPVIPPKAAMREWGADYVTADPFELVKVLMQSKGVLTVIDEYGRYRKKFEYEQRLEWCTTEARNWGHLTHCCAQRLMMIPPSVRNNCDNAVVFRQARKDLAELAEHHDQPSLMDVAGWPKGLAYTVRPFEPLVKIRVFELRKGKPLIT